MAPHYKAPAQLRTLYVREIIRSFMETHLGCTAKEAAWGTGVSIKSAGLAIRAIRKEWLKDGNPRGEDKSKTKEGIKRFADEVLALYARTNGVRDPRPRLSLVHSGEVRSDRDESQSDTQVDATAGGDEGRDTTSRRLRVRGV